MYVFGITGTTGAGKSTVSKELAKRGVHICDCDKIAREITAKDSECLSELSKSFGNGILNSDGALNRGALAEIAFNDEKKLALLNSITHRYIKDKISDEIDTSSDDMFAIDGAVIIGSPVRELCRCLVVVMADRNIRLNRIMERDGITKKAAENRINAQLSDEEYLKNADYVIYNNGDLSRLGDEIEQLYIKIKNSCETC